MARFRERSLWNYTTKRGGDDRYQNLLHHALLSLAVAVTAQEHPVRCLHGIHRKLAHHGDGDKHSEECHGFYVVAMSAVTV